MPSLPEIPKAEVEIVADRSDEREGFRFLTVKRLDLRLAWTDGRQSRPFRYDVIERRAVDAAVIAAHYIHEGKRWVYLRSAIRPPIALRSLEPQSSPVLWELPAGLVEPGETPIEGARREIEEELGFTLDRAELLPLGAGAFPAPGFIAEMHWFFHARVDPKTRVEPVGDGHPVEEGARVISVTLEDALAACRSGEIADEKTELGLRRLADTFG